MKTFILILSIFTIVKMTNLNAMDYKEIQQLNEKLLAEDDAQAAEPKVSAHKEEVEKAFEIKKKKKESKSISITAAQPQKILSKNEYCSGCLRNYAVPLSCLLFISACVVGGAFCKQSPTCMYGANDNVVTNGTSSNNTLLGQPYPSIDYSLEQLTASRNTSSAKQMVHYIKRKKKGKK
jgi:hypothetical protein